MTAFTFLDYSAASFFVVCWLAVTWFSDRSPWRRHSLSFLMHKQRRDWLNAMRHRELRMVDTGIIAGLQQGAAFFASTSIIAIGGCFALFRSHDTVQAAFDDLPMELQVDPAVWEAKLLGLVLVFAYAFFKFGWAYRLFNYCSIAIGATPLHGEADTPESIRQAERAGELNVLAGRHFDAGLRAIFFAVGFLGWFIGPVFLIGSTTLVTVVIIRRQFFSAARRAMAKP